MADTVPTAGASIKVQRWKESGSLSRFWSRQGLDWLGNPFEYLPGIKSTEARDRSSLRNYNALCTIDHQRGQILMNFACFWGRSYG